MHDPMTVAHEIKYPWKPKPNPLWKGDTQPRNTFITIWHNDPCKDGSDDSCGWFMRARHGDKKVLEKIIKRIEWDWDRTFTSESSGKTYFTGYFYPENAGSGMPNLSVIAIVLNFFFLAALEHFGSRDKAMKFCQKNLFEIMLFAENPFDSISDSITRKFGCDEKREERIRGMASTIYGWILRKSQPWYRHPRWHFWHWSFQVHPLQAFKRRWWDKCSRCGRRGFRPGECAIGNWDGNQVWHEACGHDHDKNPVPTP